MIRYHVTRHAHLEGARLSREGHWGNVPHSSVDEAVKAAERDAAGQPFHIETHRFPALSTPLVHSPRIR